MFLVLFVFGLALPEMHTAGEGFRLKIHNKAYTSQATFLLNLAIV